MLAALLVLASLPATAALAASVSSTTILAAQRLRRPAVRACAADDELEQNFAAELARRRSGVSGPPSPDSRAPSSPDSEREPFTGIQEIVLDDQGRPQAVPRRPPPPPASTIAADIAELFRSPEFVLGTVLSVGSLVLILLISSADAGA